MASIEFGDYSLAFSSGCAAITAVLHLLKFGDHVIASNDLYGGTNIYMQNYTKGNFGIEFDFVDLTNFDNIEKAIKPNTKLIWIESPTNPTLRVVDIRAITKMAKKKGILTVCDNTFANPYLQSPLLLGVDISLSSCTKYIGGHSDIVMGVLVFNTYELYEELFIIAESIGACPSALDCFLCLRGIKTLEVRTARICQNAYTLANFLEKHPLVERVLYPGLKSH